MADTLTTDAGQNTPGRCLAEPSTFAHATAAPRVPPRHPHHHGYSQERQEAEPERLG